METQVVIMKSSKGVRSSDAVSVFRKGDYYSIPAVSESLMENILEHDGLNEGIGKGIGVKKVVLEDVSNGERHAAAVLCLECSGEKVMRGRVFGPPFIVLPWRDLKDFERDSVLFSFYYFNDSKVERFAVVLSNFVELHGSPSESP